MIENIKEELSHLDVENIEEINVINNSLYFIKTKEKTYTYDVESKTLEESGLIAESDVVQKLTIEEKNKIAEENIALIHYVIKGFINTGIDYDELESIGNYAFAKALDSFDKMKGIRFSTYAINCISNEVLFFLRKEKKHFTHDISINKELQTDGKGNVLTLEDTIEDETFSIKGIDNNILKEETKEMLLEAISQLDEDEQHIMLYRYGLDGRKARTQNQLAKELDMSQANISKLQRNCLKKLRFILNKMQSN